MAHRWPATRFDGMESALQLLRARGYAPRVIIDCGANLGQWLRVAASVFPDASWHAVEPQPKCVAALQQLGATFPNLTVHATALSAPGAGTVRMIGGGDGTGPGNFVMTEHETVAGASTMPSTTLDALLADSIQAGDRALLKLDVEGHEIPVLTGAARLLTAVDVVLTAAPGFRHRLAIADDAFVVAFVGRLHRIKRLDLLAQAFVDLRRTHPDAQLVIAGPDEDGLLAGVMRTAGAQAAGVHAIGSVNDADKWALLRSADVSVQCSDSESFGLAVVEGMAASKPVVVTRTCPWSAIETHGCGFWVEQSAAGIAAGLRALADSPERAQEMGRAGARFARDRYGWDVIGRSIAGLYEEILARKGNQRVA